MNRNHFASWNSTAPLDASSGDQTRHRLSSAGNRQINRALHVMAIVQLRNQTEGRAHFDRRKAAGKTSMEAMRSLMRRLSDIVYRTMIADAITFGAGPGGQRGNDSDSSAAGPKLHTSTSEKRQPGPTRLSLRGACAASTDMQLSKSMRANTNILVGALNTPDAWAYSNASVRRLAIRAILSIRPDWTPPEFALPRRAPRTE